MAAVNPTASSRWHAFLLWSIGTTVLVELITIILRFQAGVIAVEFNKTAPLLLQIHHMFWSIPLFAVAPFTWKRPWLSGTILGIAVGFIASDAIQHLIVLPLTVGNTGLALALIGMSGCAARS